MLLLENSRGDKIAVYGEEVVGAAVDGGGDHYALRATPLLGPLHTLTAAHSFFPTCFLKPLVNNEGFS